MKKIAFYGGSFDPLHNGHLTIARRLTGLFGLDKFIFIPAFHAPHKKRQKPTSAFHRFAMLALATENEARIRISTLELEAPERPYTFETLARLKNDLPDTEIFFVMGADSWAEITTWREWEKVLTTVNIIVVSRPGYEIGFSHITGEIRERIVDLRSRSPESDTKFETCNLRDQNKESPVEYEVKEKLRAADSGLRAKIFITDAVRIDVSATEIRQKIRNNEGGWHELVPQEVANYIEKYEIY